MLPVIRDDQALDDRQPGAVYDIVDDKPASMTEFVKAIAKCGGNATTLVYAAMPSCSLNHFWPSTTTGSGAGKL